MEEEEEEVDQPLQDEGEVSVEVETRGEWEVIGQMRALLYKNASLQVG